LRVESGAVISTEAKRSGEILRVESGAVFSTKAKALSLVNKSLFTFECLCKKRISRQARNDREIFPLFLREKVVEEKKITNNNLKYLL